MIDAATARAPAWSASGRRIANSSPATRATTSLSRSRSRRTPATDRSSSSPIACPSESLTYLKWSRSRSRSAPRRPWRALRARWRESSSSRRRRLNRPVSGSRSAASRRRCSKTFRSVMSSRWATMWRGCPWGSRTAATRMATHASASPGALQPCLDAAQRRLDAARVGEQAGDVAAVVADAERLERRPPQVGRRAAGEPLERAVGPADRAVELDERDPDGRALERRAEAPLARAQPLAVGAEQRAEQDERRPAGGDADRAEVAEGDGRHDHDQHGRGDGGGEAGAPPVPDRDERHRHAVEDADGVAPGGVRHPERGDRDEGDHRAEQPGLPERRRKLQPARSAGRHRRSLGLPPRRGRPSAAEYLRTAPPCQGGASVPALRAAPAPASRGRSPRRPEGTRGRPDSRAAAPPPRAGARTTGSSTRAAPSTAGRRGPCADRPPA